MLIPFQMKEGRIK